MQFIHSQLKKYQFVKMGIKAPIIFASTKEEAENKSRLKSFKSWKLEEI